MSELSGLRHQLVDRVGYRCEWPDCYTADNDVLEMAHIIPKGMGGSPSGAVNVVDNVWLLCRWHHDLFDGRTMTGRQAEYRRLVGAYVRLARET